MKVGDNMNCAAVFCNKFRGQIAEIRTADQRNRVLSDMQEDFVRQVRHEPDNRNQLSEAYQLLKRECWEMA